MLIPRQYNNQRPSLARLSRSTACSGPLRGGGILARRAGIRQRRIRGRRARIFLLTTSILRWPVSVDSRYQPLRVARVRTVVIPQLARERFFLHSHALHRERERRQEDHRE